MQVMGVVNFPPRQIGPVRSEVLVLGLADANGDIVLLRPDHDVPLGERMQ
jgi:tRNA-binding protein